MMRAWILTFLMAGSAVAFGEQLLVNPGFEDGLSGWHFNRLAGYDGELVAEAKQGSAAFRIWSVAGEPGKFAPVLQQIDAAPLRGKTVRFRAWVRYEKGEREGAAQLWMRVDRPEKKVGFFDNMGHRPVTESTWTVHEIVGPVSADAERLTVGGLLRGGGSMWIDETSVEIIGSDRAASEPTSDEAAEYLEAAISLIENQSIRRELVQWAAVRAGALQIAQGAAVPRDTYPAIRWVLSELGDRHSYFREPANASAWLLDGGAEPIPEPELREGAFGYIAIPPFIGADQEAAEKYAAAVQRGIAAIDDDARCGWIVDLRDNGGGNMWPMLSGLGPLLGEGPILEFRSVDDWTVIEYRDGRAFYRHLPRPELRGFVYKPPHIRPVAVLTSSSTASSGEAVAIAFRGRSRTRSFGRATAGLSTANQSIRLSDGALIFLTSAVMGDREGRMYGESLQPDVQSVGDEETLAIAMEWLREESDCAEEADSVDGRPPRASRRQRGAGRARGAG